MTLNPTRSNAPHVFVTSVTESQISFHFALRPAVFELHFKTNAPKWPQNDNGQVKFGPTRSNVSHMYTIVPSLKFQPFSYYGQPLSS